MQATSQASGEGGRTPGRGLFAALFIDAVGSGLWLPFNLIFFTRAQGVSLGSVGIALTLGALAGLVVGQLSGGVLDRVGPHRALVVSNIARAVIFGVYPFVHHPIEVALVVAVVSSGDRVFWTANYPYLSSWSRGREVDKMFGTIGVLQLVGLGLGAAAAGTFANSTGALHLLAWLNAASFAVSGILIARQPARPIEIDMSEPDRLAGRPRSVWVDRPYLLLCGVQILLVLLNSSYVIILPLLILRNFHGPTWLVGLSIVVANAVLAGCQKRVLRFTRSRPRRTAILAALPVYVVSFGLLVGLDHRVGEGTVVAAVLIAAALGGFGESLSITLMISAADAAAPADSKVRYSAAFQTSWGLAEVIAPLLFTRLLLGGNAVLWLTLAVLAVLTAPVVMRASRSLPPSVLALAGSGE